MLKATEWCEIIGRGDCDKQFGRLYQTRDAAAARARWLRLLDDFIRLYGDRDDTRLFSAPGRTELCGNHTDHQNGCALAASVTMDKIAVAAPDPDGPITLRSAQYPLDAIDWRDLAPHPNETGHSPSLIRGVAAGFSRKGYRLGGFLACTDSALPSGSGLSSSASFELLAAMILNALYNGGRLTPIEMAKTGCYAESVYFGKPCGQMDQLACALGSAVVLDFRDPTAPMVERIPLTFRRWGYSLYSIYTGGSHSDITAEYAAIPSEMQQVAAAFGQETLRSVSPENFYASLDKLRSKLSDRALLRAMHFFAENVRVMRMVEAIRSNDAKAYCDAMIASGRSSFCRLQNIYPCELPKERGLALGLALCEDLLDGCGGWRVHGGGFAGTIQALVPLSREKEFRRVMGAVFGEKNCHLLRIRPVGACELKAPVRRTKEN